MYTECSRAYHTAVELIGQELHPNQHFRCAANGDYDEIQCIGENCYCVNATDGSPTSEDGAKMSAVNITVLAKDEIDCCKYSTKANKKMKQWSSNGKFLFKSTIKSIVFDLLNPIMGSVLS